MNLLTWPWQNGILRERGMLCHRMTDNNEYSTSREREGGVSKTTLDRWSWYSRDGSQISNDKIIPRHFFPIERVYPGLIRSFWYKKRLTFFFRIRYIWLSRKRKSSFVTLPLLVWWTSEVQPWCFWSPQWLFWFSSVRSMYIGVSPIFSTITLNVVLRVISMKMFNCAWASSIHIWRSLRKPCENPIMPLTFFSTGPHQHGSVRTSSDFADN